MKQKIAWLALPFLLAALMFGVKWRADHPPLTKEDLEIRALMRQAAHVEVDFDPINQKLSPFNIWISRKESSPLIDSFWFSSQPIPKVPRTTKSTGQLSVLWILPKQRGNGVDGAFINIDVANNTGVFHFGDPNHIVMRDIHPVTVRRFLNFLLSKPNIGPKLRARLNL